VRFFFAFTLLVSAALLFMVEPMFARMVLPLLGGAPAVWNTCLVFYQAALLAGYVYAHVSSKYLGPRRQAMVHLALLGLACIVLPLGVSTAWSPPVDQNPAPWLLAILVVSVGLPFVALSASAPMIQSWFARTDHPSARDPYFLYASSNLGSLIGLLGYPLVLERVLTLRGQSLGWSVGYGLLVLLTLGCAIVMWRRRADTPAQAEAPDSDNDAEDRPVTWRRRLRWVVLALIPSSLLLGVTTFMSTDVAALPLLWAIPLALYLLTFVLVFARRRILPHGLMVAAQPLLLVFLAGAFFLAGLQASQIVPMLVLSLLAFFVTAMVCHGELADDRPHHRYLTEFYLWLSVGGVLGGAFNALLAPVIFAEVLELPLMLAAACMVRPALRPRFAWLGRAEWALFLVVVPLGLTVAVAIRWQESVGRHIPRLAELPVDSALQWMVIAMLAIGGVALLLQYRPIRFGLAVIAMLVIGRLCNQQEFRPLYVERSFFGIVRVEHHPDYGANMLVHGRISHGMQSTHPDRRREPLTYYHRKGPAGQIFRALDERLNEIGVVGLGTGSLAAYGRAGQRVTFYEIDPVVEKIARDRRFFTYLADCRARVEVILGDARRQLAEGPPRRFDLLAIDAFSSDAIPVHLVTREAVRVYFERLSSRGVLALHISNQHLDLRPVLGNLAADAGLVALICDDDEGEGPDRAKFASTWVVLARSRADLGALATSEGWSELPPRPGQRLWTDDFSNIIDVLEWQPTWAWLSPNTWLDWQRQERRDSFE
jgi:MFS family permease